MSNVVSPADLDYLSDVVKRQAGLSLGRDKLYLFESRLLPLAKKRSLVGISDVVSRMRSGDAALQREVAEAMTTNESFFFRDGKPFELFRKVTLPHLLTARAARRSIRVWSAACSTGQEPYSLAMILQEESAKLAGWTVEIVATDLSRDVLARAKQGIYTQFEVQRGLPIQLLVKHFTQQGEVWHIADKLKRMVTFREANLLESFGSLGRFDVVICRNVLIYFDQPTKADILARMAALLPSDGALYLGGAETVLGVSDRFEPTPGHHGLYRRVA